MRARALLPFGGVRGLRRVMEETQAREGCQAEVLEVSFVEVERQSETLHQPFGEPRELVVIRLHGGAEARQSGRPLVRTIMAGVFAACILSADVEALLQIGRRAGLERLPLQGLIAMAAGRMSEVESLLLVGRQIEERRRVGKHRCDERRLDAMIRNVEEAFVFARGPKLPPDGAAIARISADKARHVDDRQRALIEAACAQRVRERQGESPTSNELRYCLELPGSESAVYGSGRCRSGTGPSGAAGVLPLAPPDLRGRR